MLVKLFDVDQGKLNPKHFEVLKLWNCSLRLWLPWLEPSVSCSKLSIYDSTAQPSSQNMPFGTFKSGAARSALQNFINHIGSCARANELFLAQNISKPKWYLAMGCTCSKCAKTRLLKKDDKNTCAAQTTSTLWTALPLLRIAPKAEQVFRSFYFQV